jgi:hypothetical protein
VGRGLFLFFGSCSNTRKFYWMKNQGPESSLRAFSNQTYKYDYESSPKARSHLQFGHVRASRAPDVRCIECQRHKCVPVFCSAAIASGERSGHWKRDIWQLLKLAKK